MFILITESSNLQNGFGTQYGLVIQSFGFTTAQTTALNVPAGVAMIIGITSSTLLLRRYPVCYPAYHRLRTSLTYSTSTEFKMLDCSGLFCTVSFKCCAADGFTMEQSGWTIVRILHQQLRWSTIFCYGGFLGCCHHFGTHKSINTFPIFRLYAWTLSS